MAVTWIEASRWRRFGPCLVMLAGVLAWLWPIGLGGRMLVGGDVTQFSMGLMGFLRASLRAGRLPLWNDLWGFGFPGLAESQMGVFYPLHLGLYGGLPTEFAYVASLIFHTLWGALGAYWGSRKLGTSRAGAALSGFAFSTCGFFLIHLSHQWGYTVGSWMPWAWGLTWLIARGEGNRRSPWLLAAVLTLQVLPGHFQLAFVTEVGCVALAMVAGGRSIARRAAVVAALAAMIPLASMQLWPTYRLARLSESRRDYEYLSGFAATPVHLVGFAAPGLFHRSPLWRPVAWDPFHTSPEELLNYVGLIPLFLALGAIAKGWRGDPASRALAIVAGLTLLLALGPYVPGFAWLTLMPGFSFFRAPARWGLGTSLALALLAGRGFDRLATWDRPGRSAVRFSLACLALVGLVVGGFELALASSRGETPRPIADGFERALKALPWADQPRERSFLEVMAVARRPRSELRILMDLARVDGALTVGPGPSLESRRLAIYGVELAETGALLVSIVLAGVLAGRPRVFSVALLAIALADALLLARHRPFDLGPMRPLVEQSPVLARLSREPRGTRTLDPAKNLFMIAGVDTLWAYRTLDLPAPIGLIQNTWGNVAGPQARVPMRIAGVDARLLDAVESQGVTLESLQPWWAQVEAFEDPALAGWIFGTDFTRLSGLRDFYLVRPDFRPSKAWLLPSRGLEEADGMTNTVTLVDKFRGASPLVHRSDTPERVEVDATVDNPAASMVVLSSTYDPEWRAWLAGPSGTRRDARVVKVLGGWQGVILPEPGRWTIHLEYPGTAVRTGLAVSAFAWLAWLVSLVGVGLGRSEAATGRLISTKSEGGS